MKTKTKNTYTGYAVFNSCGTMLWHTIAGNKQWAIDNYKEETGDPLPESFKVRRIKIITPKTTT